MTSIYSTWTEPRKLDTNLEGDMGKYTEQTKLTATEDYCGGHSSLKTVARRHSVEFKLSVLKRVRDEGLSLRQAAALFDIPRFDMIGHWERQYREGGLDAL